MRAEILPTSIPSSLDTARFKLFSLVTFAFTFFCRDLPSPSLPRFFLVSSEMRNNIRPVYVKLFRGQIDTVKEQEFLTGEFLQLIVFSLPFTSALLTPFFR